MKLLQLRSRALARGFPASAAFLMAAALVLGLAGLAGAAPTPSPPRQLAATAVSASEIALTWQNPPGNEDSYTIERSVGSTSSFSAIAVLSAGSLSYRDAGLTSGVTYYYRAYSSNKKGDSPYSNIASATTLGSEPGTEPAAPSGLTATAVSSSQVNLSWSDNASNESGFRIDRSLSASSGFAQIATVGANVTSYASTGLSADTTYYYRVRAYNSAGNSAYSNTASATTTTVPPASGPPAAPTNLTAVGAADRINLTWVDNSTNEDRFDIWRKVEGGYWVPLTQVSANATSYSDYSPEPAILYYYLVRAHNTAGSSAWSNTASAALDEFGTADSPSAPSGLNAAPASSSEIDLSWTDASDNETGFRIERSFSVTSGFMQIATVGANVTSYSNTGLSPATAYVYRVCAHNAAGNSAYSNLAITSTLDVPPAAPSALSATAVSSSQIDLTWVDNATNETGFEVERSLSATTGFALVASVGVNVTSYQNPGLSPSTTYYYRVRARNSAGASDWSNAASATTSVGVAIGLALDVITVNEYAYIATLEGVVAVSIQDPTTPVVTGLAETEARVYHHDGRAGLVVGACGFNGVAIVDTTDPALPRVASSLAFPADDVTLDGDVAYAVDRAGYLRVIDVWDPAEPALIAELPLEGQPSGIAVEGGYAYVASGSVLLAVDVRSPAAPAVVGSLPIPCRVVTAEGSVVYTDGVALGGLTIVNASDPANLWQISEYTNYGYMRGIVVRDAMAYVAFYSSWGASSGLYIVDCAAPAEPQMTRAVGTDGSAMGIAVSDVYAYVADGASGLAVFDVSDPYDPVLVGTAQ